MINGVRNNGVVPLARRDVGDGATTADITDLPENTFQAYRAPAVQLSPAARAEANLTDAQRAQFEQLKQALPDDTASLNRLLVNGGLTERDSAGATMLDNLVKLTQPGLQLKGGADPHQLLSTLVQESADPTQIMQGVDNEFCGAAAASQALATKNPAEYARIVEGLAIDGKVDVAATHSSGKGHGSTLSLPADFQANDPDRSLTQQYLAQPLTQLAAGNEEQFDRHGDGHVHNQMVVGHRDDGSQVTVGPSVQPGTFANQVADMQSDLTGRDYDAASLPPPGDSKREAGLSSARDVLSAQVAAKTQPAVEIDHHWFSVSKMDSQNVTLVDHLGQSSTMSLDDFFNKAVAFTYDRAVSPTIPPELSYDGRGGPGGGWNPSAGQNRPGT